MTVDPFHLDADVLTRRGRHHRPPADGADAGHPPRWAVTDRYDDLVSVQLADGTIVTDRRNAPTVDTFLRDPHRIERQLRQMADELGISEMMFPRPIMDRIRDRAADLRDGRSIRRYRGAHRTGGHTVDTLTEACIEQRSARAADHRRALRRPPKPIGPVEPVYLGDRMTTVRLWIPGDPGDPEKIEGTLTIEPGEEYVLSVPVLQGPPGEPIADISEANTGPLEWQPAVAMLGDMFEPWPSVEALGG